MAQFPICDTNNSYFCQRIDTEKTGHRLVITSDVGRQILQMNQKAKEEWDKKQAEEADKNKKQTEVFHKPHSFRASVNLLET